MSTMEDSLRNQLRELKQSGACYLQLRRNDEGVLSWVCFLCRKIFISVADLQNHLSADIHVRLREFASNTLLKANRWPFYDTLTFGLGISSDLDVKNVLCYGDIGDMRLDFMGVCPIFWKLSEDRRSIKKIWAEWRTKTSLIMEEEIPLHHLSIVNFKCNLTLGVQAATSMELQQISHNLYHRMCQLCGSAIPPGSDVSTLLNNRSSMLSCSYSNTKGMYHLFHTSCLLNWILLMEGMSQSGPTIQLTPEISPQYLAKFQDYHYCPECCDMDINTHFIRTVVRLRSAIRNDCLNWTSGYEPLENSSLGLSFCFDGHPPHSPAQGNAAVKLLRVYQGHA